MLAAADVAAIVRHMNEDHADALLLYARAFGGAPQARSARLLTLDADALDMEVAEASGRRRLRIALAQRLEGVGDARRVLVEMAEAARRRLGGTTTR